MYRFNTYKEQYKANLRLALPVVLTQLGQILTQVADSIMVGQYGGADPTPLAAVSFGGAVSFLFMIAAMGVSFGLTPLVGEHYVRGEHRESAALLQNGLLFYALIGLATTLLQVVITPLLYHMGQPTEVVVMSIPYYRMLLLSMVPMMLFFAFKQYLEGVGNTRAELWATIIANGLNLLLNYVFIFGHWGAPAMGAEGAGLATLLARIAGMVAIFVYFVALRRYREVFRLFSRRAFSRRAMWRLTKIGTPISMQMFLESSAFIVTGLLVGLFGTAALGANHITITLGNCAFMIIVSISSATTIRVSHCYGLRAWNELALAAKASYHLGLAWNSIAAVTFILLRHWIPSLFTDNEEVIEIASQLLIFAALYQLSDAMQNISVGILRGLQDVKIIMPIAFIAYWLLNLPASCLFGFTCGMGPNGLFLGYSVGLTAAALLMIGRIRRTMRRLRSGRLSPARTEA